MSKNKKIETRNQYENKLNELLFMFIDDEMDYGRSQFEIVNIIKIHTLYTIGKVQKMRKQR